MIPNGSRVVFNNNYYVSPENKGKVFTVTRQGNGNGAVWLEGYGWCPNNAIQLVEDTTTVEQAINEIHDHIAEPDKLTISRATLVLAVDALRQMQNNSSVEYVLIDKANGFGYGRSKYAGMFNMTMPEFADVYEDASDANDIADGLNKSHGYCLQVFELSEAMMDVIERNAEKVRDDIEDKVTRNRMWSIIHALARLRKAIAK